MIWDNAYEKEPRKRPVYLRCCDFILLSIPRYMMDWGNVDDPREQSEIWKRAKKCVLGK